MENEKQKSASDRIKKKKVAQGTYANLAIITHSSSEFILDFVRVMPGLPKAGVQSRTCNDSGTCKASDVCIAGQCD